jgi:DNA-directed RNA polymerase subunit RPC12/RpoP
MASVYIHCIFCGFMLPGIIVSDTSDWDVRKVKCPNCGEEILIESRQSPDTKAKVIIKSC